MSAINSQPETELCEFKGFYNPASIQQRRFLQANAPKDIKTKMEQLDREFEEIEDAMIGLSPTRHDSVLEQERPTQAAEERSRVMHDYAALSLAEHTRQSTLLDCPGRHCPRHDPNYQLQVFSAEDPDESAASDPQTRLGDDSTIGQ